MGSSTVIADTARPRHPTSVNGISLGDNICCATAAASREFCRNLLERALVVCLILRKNGGMCLQHVGAANFQHGSCMQRGTVGCSCRFSCSNAVLQSL